MKIRIKKNSNITDFFMCAYICIILAFRDYSNLIIVTSILMFIWLIFKKIKNAKINKYLGEYAILKLLFIAICVVSSLWSINPNILHLGFSMIFRLIVGFCILLYVDNRESFVKILKMLVFGAIVLCLRMILIIPIDAWGNSRVGMFLSKDPDNSYGNTGVTYVLGVVSILLFSEKGQVIKSIKIKYSLIVIFSFFSLMSGSKKQLFMLFIAFFLCVIFDSKSLNKFIKNILVACIGVVILFYAIYNIPLLYNAIGYRIESFFLFFSKDGVANLNDLSTITRQQFMKEAYNVFCRHPLFGVGIDSFKYYNQIQFTWAENNFLELLADLGITGMIIYYIPHIIIVKSLLLQKRKKDIFYVNNIILFVVLISIDLTMVSYNEIHLQLYLSLLFSYVFIFKSERQVKDDE